MSEYPPNHYAERVWAGDRYHYPGIERLLARIATLEAENAKLAKLNAAYWAEIQSYRRDAYCLNDEGKATDAARKEAGL